MQTQEDEQREQRKEPSRYIKRALEPLVLRYSSLFKVIVLTGSRQVGKTTLLKHLIEYERTQGKSRAYVTLDDTAQRMLAKEDPALFLQRYQPPVLIDEIQYAPELLPFIKVVVDDSNDKGGFWLTGSQPFHLMKNISESLAGRVGIIEMLGLSQTELNGYDSEPFALDTSYFKRRAAALPPRTINQVFDSIARGSFPEIALLPEDARAAGFESFISTYLMRDIRDLAQVGDELRFRRFMSACASLTARPVVYAELARIADIDEKTAKTWLSLLCGSYLVKLVQPYSNNLLKRLSKQPVMHFMDTGLCAHLAGWSNPKALEQGAMSGQVFESFAFGEIYRSFLNAGMKQPVHFFRTNDKKEIDLLIEENGTLHPVEIKKSAAPVSADTKNFSALDPAAQDDVPDSLRTLRRDIGLGCVVCMASDAYPVNERAWAMPVWAV